MSEQSESIKYFERKIHSLEKSMVAADRRGDEGAVAGLRKKMIHYRQALKALREVENDEH